MNYLTDYLLDKNKAKQQESNKMGIFQPDAYKVGRRFNYGDNQIIEITGRKRDGSYTYSIVNPKTGYLMKGFGGTIAPPKRERIMKNNPANPMVNIIDEEAEYQRSLNDPNDDIITVGEYDSSIAEEGDEPVTPFDNDQNISKGLANLGSAVKILGKAAIAAGTVSGMTLGFVLGPVAGFAIAMTGMFTFLGSDLLGNYMRKKAGIIYKKVYTA